MPGSQAESGLESTTGAGAGLKPAPTIGQFAIAAQRAYYSAIFGPRLGVGGKP